jgi:hypothetical protein
MATAKAWKAQRGLRAKMKLVRAIAHRLHDPRIIGYVLLVQAVKVTAK